MTCCIVGLLIFAVVGRIRRVFGGGADDTSMLFAPVAQRPAPGQSMAACVSVLADAGVARRPETTPTFRYCSIGIAICLIAAPALVWSGIMANTGSPASWLLRGGCYLVLALVAFRLSRSATILRAPSGAGTLLVIIGAVIFELGVIDMHVFRLFEIDHENIMGDMVFHSAGPVVAMLGGLVLLYGAAGRSITSRRSSRSTLSTAQPSSSAVRVSSTPPVTT
ncbi:MAG: hypothetical protein NT156_10775 [Mycobacterium sp.]|nr:hypothetical protein [Mycobacterium sp.]